MSDNDQMTTARKRKQHEIGRDRALISVMSFKSGLTQQEIADELNMRPDVGYTLTRRMIGYEINQIKEEWIANQDDQDFWVAEAVQRTYWVEAAAWEGWDKSLKPKEREIVKTGFHGASDFEEVHKMHEESIGDKGFLKIILDAISERNRLRGIGAARLRIDQRTEHVIKTYAVVSPADWDAPAVDGEYAEVKNLESGTNS